MKNKLKHITTLLFLAATASSVFGQIIADSFDSVSVERYTLVKSGKHIRNELGFLTAEGFAPTYSSETDEWTTPTAEELAEVAPVSGKIVMSSGIWTAYATAQNYTRPMDNYTRSSRTYTISGVPYYEVWWNGAPSSGGGIEIVVPRLVNMSVRAVVPPNGNVIPGFIVADGTKRVLIRASGPALAAFGVPGTLPNPKIVVYKGEQVVAENDDWSSTTTNRDAVLAAGAKAGAFEFAANSADASLVVDLEAGGYTAHISSSTSGASGEILLEVFEVPQD